MSIIKQTIDTLRKDNIKVFSPSTHTGECTEPYIVVKLDGATTEVNVSAERPIYTIMCYVPYNEYTKLEDIVLRTKQRMKEMYPLLMYVGNQTPSVYDEQIKAHMISFQYLNCRKIESSNKF